MWGYVLTRSMHWKSIVCGNHIHFTLQESIWGLLSHTGGFHVPVMSAVDCHSFTLNGVRCLASGMTSLPIPPTRQGLASSHIQHLPSSVSQELALAVWNEYALSKPRSPVHFSYMSVFPTRIVTNKKRKRNLYNKKNKSLTLSLWGHLLQTKSSRQ